MLSSVRIGSSARTSEISAPKPFPNGPGCDRMLHEIEKNGLGRGSRAWRGDSGEPKAQKTKRTQFDPLFSIKDRNESQIPAGRLTVGRTSGKPSDAMLHRSEPVGCYEMLHEIKKSVSPEKTEGSLARTQNEKTKRTQFNPLFSTKTRNESQFRRPIDNPPQLEQPATLPGWIMVLP